MNMAEASDVEEEFCLMSVMSNNSKANSVCSPPLSFSMAVSQYAQVVFHNLSDSYPTDSNIICKYSMQSGINHTKGDRIGIYPVGWQYVNDAVFVQNAPKPSQAVFFKADVLPKDDGMYQLCYLTAGGVIAGASVPFCFRRPNSSELVAIEDPTMPECLVVKSRFAISQDIATKLTLENEMLSKKILDLKEELKKSQVLEVENYKLKEEIKQLVCTNEPFNSLTSLNNMLAEESSQLKEELKNLKFVTAENEQLREELKKTIHDFENYKLVDLEKMELLKQIENLSSEIRNLKGMNSENDEVQKEIKKLINHNENIESDSDTSKKQFDRIDEEALTRSLSVVSAFASKNEKLTSHVQNLNHKMQSLNEAKENLLKANAILSCELAAQKLTISKQAKKIESYQMKCKNLEEIENSDFRLLNTFDSASEHLNKHLKEKVEELEAKKVIDAQLLKEMQTQLLLLGKDENSKLEAENVQLWNDITQCDEKLEIESVDQATNKEKGTTDKQQVLEVVSALELELEEKNNEIKMLQQRLSIFRLECESSNDGAEVSSSDNQLIVMALSDTLMKLEEKNNSLIKKLECKNLELSVLQDQCKQLKSANEIMLNSYALSPWEKCSSDRMKEENENLKRQLEETNINIKKLEKQLQMEEEKVRVSEAVLTKLRSEVKEAIKMKKNSENMLKTFQVTMDEIIAKDVTQTFQDWEAEDKNNIVDVGGMGVLKRKVSENSKIKLLFDDKSVLNVCPLKSILPFNDSRQASEVFHVVFDKELLETSVFLIQLTVKSETRSFSIFFNDKDDNQVFSFNYTLSVYDTIITLNSSISHVFGEDELHLFNNDFIAPNTTITVGLTLLKDHCQVLVINNLECLAKSMAFKLRTPVSSIKSLVVNGDVELNEILSNISSDNSCCENAKRRLRMAANEYLKLFYRNSILKLKLKKKIAWDNLVSKTIPDSEVVSTNGSRLSISDSSDSDFCLQQEFPILRVPTSSPSTNPEPKANLFPSSSNYSCAQ